ncbi:PREDICTED: zinc finger CCCH domain-containing protein 14 [Nicrophorus vespilloides]|uniref:Zinc finger CCCH domain-containing protein 14 n=1 Tax=Nicrophorus vespilloides TaxID=110193 RepID=A0ABM1NIG3_NICVS|nr:PREDICTED: zinc finger CCCH domain-containing protein 14 [Nicrophorus vespilloides]
MTDVGIEVGQKMRSAIKAKLTELNCYVDDELPDYIMVMIANKRTKSQMKEDLQLFLDAKTVTFVDWLHIVLKKLKEVHVTNPDVFKKPIKRKSNEITVNEEDEEEAKKVKKEKQKSEVKSLTDDLPITANKLSEARKIIVMQEKKSEPIEDDKFDIPLLSEITSTNQIELELIEKKIRNVKSRLGLQVESDEEINFKKALKSELDIDESKLKEVPRKIIIEKEVEKPRSIHSRITFDKERDSLHAKYNAILSKHKEASQKKSILDRLGKKNGSTVKQDKVRENIMSRLGVKSTITVPTKTVKTDDATSIEEITKDVSNAVKLKSRPFNLRQANPSLLLKAVAEAQKSISQKQPISKKIIETPVEDNVTPLFTRKYKDNTKAKVSENEKLKLKNMLTSINEGATLHAEPSQSSETIVSQKFIVTLDGVDKTHFPITTPTKRTPSPIVFNKKDIPETAEKASKCKERCKYWPACKLAELCEYVHPVSGCKAFPNCKFAEKCLYVHPPCKFEASCTRRDCPYSHSKNTTSKILPAPIVVPKPSTQTCKFFPNCSNTHCAFYHPRLCKYGLFCKNQLECNFVHSLKPGNLTWRSENK